MDVKANSGTDKGIPNRLNDPARRTFICVTGLLVLWIVSLYYPQAQLPHTQPMNKGCPFPLPGHLLKEQPLQPNEGPLATSSKKLHAFLSERTAHSDIDSLSIAVVTPTGTLYEQSYGVLKANESDSQKPVSRDSIYRIASITKMFTMLETLILRERGALNLDDAIETFLPEIDYPSYGWSDYLKGGNADDYLRAPKPRITLRQLASHMSGIGRDFPPFDIGEWPQYWPVPSFKPVWTQSDIPFPNRSYEQLVESINKYPLVNLPYDYPIYSNSGIDLLGLANVAANNRSKADPKNEPQTHEDLVKRDIFEPLELNSSFYRVPYGTSLVDNLAVPKEDHKWADYEFNHADAPAGGQYSSLADLETVMKSFLDPAMNRGVITEHVVREWLHPLFTWKDGFQETGGPWEIMTTDDDVKMYSKGGNLPGYHSEFVLIPEFHYGVIVLVTGAYDNTPTFVRETVALFQPAIRALLEERVGTAYTGHWVGLSTGDEGTTLAEVKVINNVLYLTKLIVHGYDVLEIVQDEDIGLQRPRPVALWSTGRSGEFRLAFGRKSLNDDPAVGCMPYWITIDSPLYSRGAPIDLVYWDGDQLVYPSAGVRLRRA